VAVPRRLVWITSLGLIGGVGQSLVPGRFAPLARRRSWRNSITAHVAGGPLYGYLWVSRTNPAGGLVWLTRVIGRASNIIYREGFAPASAAWRH